MRLELLIVALHLLCPSIGNVTEVEEAEDDFEYTDEQRLLRYVFAGYDASVRPVYNASKIVIVNIGVTLTHIFNIDERNQVLSLNAWIEQDWHDERVTWDPEEFGNITKLAVSASAVWRPDIVLYNIAYDFDRDYSYSSLHLHFDGYVEWAPPTKIQCICRMRIDYFPFDDQFCFLEFGSWIYDKSQLDIQIMDRADGLAPFTIYSFAENGEWDIIANRTRKILRHRHGEFPTVVFELHLRRRVLYFLYNIIVPCIMLSVLTVMQFILPCESGEKITMGLSVLLAYSVFSFNIAENIPENSEAVPLIALYLTVIMAISAASVFLSVFILNIQHGVDFGHKIPVILDFIAFKILGRILKHEKLPTLPMMYPDNNSRPSIISSDFLTCELLERIQANHAHIELRQYWSELASIYDRFFFYCVFVVTLVTSTTMLLLCPRFSHLSFGDV